MRALTLLLFSSLTCACSDKEPAAIDTSEPGAAEDTLPLPQLTLREEGWLRGDLHMHTTWSDGYEDVATVVELGEYLENADFLVAHPEYGGNGLDFLAISDHNTNEAASDPGFTSERLVLIPSEEVSMAGHANVPGISTRIDGVGTIEGVLAAVENAHAQGALFSVNHPFIEDIPFPWDLRSMDTLEAWNAGWSLASPPSTEETLSGWVASHGPASPFFTRALEAQGFLSDAQSLTWYAALLSRGIHPGLVGGSDRHGILLPGFPTTYVLAESADMSSLIQGMRARHTFISRTPASTQVLAQAHQDGSTWLFGDELPIPAAGSSIEIEVQVARAKGGLLRILAGSALESDEEVLEMPDPSVLTEESIESDLETFTITIDARPGDWLFAMVLEPLVSPKADKELAASVSELAQAVADSGASPASIAAVAGSFVDPEVFGDPSKCTPEKWEPDMLQCSLVDAEGFGSFFVPDVLDRALNVWVEDRAVTPWTMGAVTSALLFVEQD